MTAASEDQAANVWRALQPMVEMSHSLRADIPDTGETRINLPGGGRIEPVTASARSRLGQRITAALQDETHSWTALNGGRRLADNQRRNLAGMGGRFLETTNAWDPAEQSVAQHTHDAAEPACTCDRVDRAPRQPQRPQRRRMLRRVYGDSARDPRAGHRLGRPRPRRRRNRALMPRDPAQPNGSSSTASAPPRLGVRPAPVGAHADPTRTVPAGALIVIGVDGARYGTPSRWSPPRSPADTNSHWGSGNARGCRHRLRTPPPRGRRRPPRGDAHLVVWRVYIDPQWIDGLATTGRAATAPTDHPLVHGPHPPDAWACAPSPTRWPPATSATTETPCTHATSPTPRNGRPTSVTPTATPCTSSAKTAATVPARWTPPRRRARLGGTRHAIAAGARTRTRSRTLKAW